MERVRAERAEREWLDGAAAREIMVARGAPIELTDSILERWVRIRGQFDAR